MSRVSQTALLFSSFHNWEYQIQNDKPAGAVQSRTLCFVKGIETAREIGGTMHWIFLQGSKTALARQQNPQSSSITALGSK